MKKKPYALVSKGMLEHEHTLDYSARLKVRLPIGVQRCRNTAYSSRLATDQVLRSPMRNAQIGWRKIAWRAKATLAT